MKITATGLKLDLVDNKLVEDTKATQIGVRFELPDNVTDELVKDVVTMNKMSLEESAVKEYGLDWFAVKVTYDSDKFEDFVIDNVYYWPGQAFLGK